MNKRSKLIGDRKNSASFGQPHLASHQVKESHSSQNQLPPMHNFLANQSMQAQRQPQTQQSPNSIQTQLMNTQGSAHQLSQGNGRNVNPLRITSDFLQASQRTEEANTPFHIAQATTSQKGNISRKQSDFSFATQSNQKIGLNGSAARSPKVVNPGSYANKWLELKQGRNRSGSLSNRSNGSKKTKNSKKLQDSPTSKQQVGKSNQRQPQGDKAESSLSQTNTVGRSSRDSSHRGPVVAHQRNNQITSIQEEDQEIENGTQIQSSRDDPREQTSSSAIQQVLQAASSNIRNSYANSHLASLRTNTLMPQIHSYDGTPSSAQHNLNYQIPQPVGAHRSSLNQNESIGGSSNSITLLNLRLDQAIRYNELCERRILDYQPDHPLPIREEHLGLVFAKMDAQGTSGQNTFTARSNQSPTTIQTTMRQGATGTFHNKHDPNAEIGSILSNQFEGSPQAATKHNMELLATKNHKLEMALREETLSNEEQRNYIQILKNVIEQKLERDGMLELLKEAGRKKRAEQAKANFLMNQNRTHALSPSASGKEDEDAINLYIVLSDMRHQLDSKTKEVQRYVEQMKTSDEQTKQLVEENQLYQEQLHKRMMEIQHSNQRYAGFEQELGLLHKQKEDLLDCVENQVNQIEQLRNELLQEKSRSTHFEQNAHRPSQDMQGKSASQSQLESQEDNLQAQSAEHLPQHNGQPTMHMQHQVINPPQIISNPGDNKTIDITSQSLVHNGIDLSYSRDHTSDGNQTMQHQTNNQFLLNQRQQALAEQVQMVNQAAINAGHISITQQASQESMSSQNLINAAGSLSNQAIEQYQKHLTLKDQEIIRLRSQIDQYSSDIFSKQQENDSLSFAKSQLQKRLEMEQERNKQQDDFRAKQLESVQSMLQEEQRKSEDLQLHYEAEIRKCQRELNIVREEQIDRESQLEQIQRTYERQSKELELRETQLDSCKVQAQKDSKEIRDLKTKADEANLEAERLRKERERRQDAELTDGKTKEQLNREKHEVVNQLNELQHQFEVYKTQKQTEAHRSDQAVRDAQTRTEVLEKASKKQIMENETLMRDFTSCAVKLKQAEVQVGYLEKSNKQLTDEVRQTKLDYDAINRAKQKHEVTIHDLEAQIETLNLRDGSNKRYIEQLNEAQLQLKSKDNEIEKLDDKLRKLYLQKEEFEVEAIQLRKAVHELQVRHNEANTQKEMLSGQTKDNERRIFDLVRDKQDLDKKVRENVLLIRDLVEERDKYKRIVSDKDDEIQDLSLQVNKWRSSNTDLKLIEEKVDHFLTEMRHVIEQNIHSAKPQLQEFLRLVKASESLSSKVSMRKREEGHEFMQIFEEKERSRASRPAEALEGDQSNLSHIWQAMIQVKQDVVNQGKIQAFFSEMLQLFVSDSVDLNQQLVYKDRKCSTLENKLGSIHAVDFKAQSDSVTLKKELLDLQQKKKDEERRFQEEIAKLQQSLEDKSMAEKEATLELTTLKKKFNQTLSDTKTAMGSNVGNNKRLEKELWSVTAEKRRFEEVIEKIQDTCMERGSRAQDIVEDMKRCSKVLAKVDAERETALHEIEELEIRLANINSNQIGPGLDANSTRITAIQQVKNLRGELSKREDLVRDLDERISMEVDRLKNLGNELKMNAPATMTGVTNTMQTNLNSAVSRARCYRDNQLSQSPHRLQEPDRNVNEGYTPLSHPERESAFTRTQGHLNTVQTNRDQYASTHQSRFNANRRDDDDRPVQDYFGEASQQQSRFMATGNINSPYGGTYNARLAQNEATAGTVSSQTQQLNTDAMANLLKDANENGLSNQRRHSHQQQQKQHQFTYQQYPPQTQRLASDGTSSELPDRLHHSGGTMTQTQGTAVINTAASQQRYQNQAPTLRKFMGGQDEQV